MLITDIAEYTRSKYKIYIDDVFAFVLYKGEIHKLGLEKGKKIKDETLELIQNEILPKRAKLRAMNLLQKRPYTEYEMRDKLSKNLYDNEVIDIAIDYLKSFGYIDDKAYVTQYIDTYTEQRSVKTIINKLMQKGIDKRLIYEVIEEKRENDELGDEDAMIKKILQKRGFDPDTADIKEIAKTARFLYSKGFESSAISRVMKQDF